MMRWLPVLVIVWLLTANEASAAPFALPALSTPTLPSFLPDFLAQSSLGTELRKIVNDQLVPVIRFLGFVYLMYYGMLIGVSHAFGLPTRGGGTDIRGDLVAYFMGVSVFFGASLIAGIFSVVF